MWTFIWSLPQPWLRAKLGLLSQKTKLAEAIRYALSRWNGLTRFIAEARIEIDSHVVQRRYAVLLVHIGQ
ncbi:IS66 family transposase (plasmid) [Bradyrhizobium barranii subsp. apii]|nr:IS66 family transposase [Bradyrhizobium barranii]UPU01342.1 IS66 family transposase [Bradyrhizobium barranii subsp. apii]